MCSLLHMPDWSARWCSCRLKYLALPSLTPGISYYDKNSFIGPLRV